MSDDKGYDIPDLTGLSREDVIAARNDLMENEDFQKAMVAGKSDAKKFLADFAKAIVNEAAPTGSGSLSEAEVRLNRPNIMSGSDARRRH